MKRLTLGFLVLMAIVTAQPLQAKPLSPEELFSDRILGNPNAPVTVYEYLGAFHPATSRPSIRFHLETLPKLMQNYIYTGKVRLIIREFPVGRRDYFSG